MSDCMYFPEDWKIFLHDYSFQDSKHIYTNGSELIPTFRVEQLIEHLLAKKSSVNAVQYGWQCPVCLHVYSPTTTMCTSCGRKTASAAHLNDTDYYQYEMDLDHPSLVGDSNDY